MAGLTHPSREDVRTRFAPSQPGPFRAQTWNVFYA